MGVGGLASTCSDMNIIQFLNFFTIFWALFRCLCFPLLISRSTPIASQLRPITGPYQILKMLDPARRSRDRAQAPAIAVGSPQFYSTRLCFRHCRLRREHVSGRRRKWVNGFCLLLKKVSGRDAIYKYVRHRILTATADVMTEKNRADVMGGGAGDVTVTWLF